MSSAADEAAWTHGRAVVDGVGLHYVEAGAGPLVLFLHGFPEFWYSWRHQLPAVAAAGYRPVAPDLRGYNESDKPPRVGDYRLSRLAADVVGLIDHFGAARATVVGHDWGGAIAWAVAATYPDRVDRLVILNAPHPAAFLRELTNPVQWLRSSYILFFQTPWLPEWVLSAGGFSLVRRVFRRQPTRPGAFTPEDIHRYRHALSRPGALTAALNYYRATCRHPAELRRSFPTIAAPTLLIWGEQDPYLGIGLTRGLDRWVPDLRVVRLPGASHWVQHDEPARVSQLILDFLAGRGDLRSVKA